MKERKMGEREPGNKRILVGFMNSLLDEADVKVVKFRNMNPSHLNMQYNSVPGVLTPDIHLSSVAFFKREKKKKETHYLPCDMNLHLAWIS